MKVVCAHCGLPFSVGRAEPGRAMYCCSGCALAARMATGTGEPMTLNATAVTVLGAGFVFFNQVLGWLLSVALTRTEAPTGWVTAEGLARVSLSLGVALWLAQIAFLFRSGTRRHVVDVFVWMATAGAIAGATLETSAGWAVAGNAALAAWTLRGLARKRGGGL